MMSNFDNVKQWMRAAGQDVPSSPTPLDDRTDHLRKKLINEEYIEYLAAETQAEQVKELVDLLVVTYGALAAMGVDGDTVFDRVMDNNWEKLDRKEVREDGKIIVPPEIKKQLKAEIETWVDNYINLARTRS